MAPPLSSLPTAHPSPTLPTSRTGRTRNRIVPHRAALTETWLRTTFTHVAPEVLPETTVERLLEITNGSKARHRPESASSRDVPRSTLEIEAEELALHRLNQTFSAALLTLATGLGLVVFLT